MSGVSWLAILLCVLAALSVWVAIRNKNSSNSFRHNQKDDLEETDCESEH